MTAIVGTVLRRPRLAETGIMMAFGLLAATALKNQVKARIDRARPYVEDEGGTYTFQRGDHDVTELNSFPSGHTAGAVAVARVVARRHPGMELPAMAAAAIVALIQMPRQKHYLTDLAAGAIVGLAADAIVGFADRLAHGSVAQARSS